MQDIVVYISLQATAAVKATLLSLILSFEKAAAYKEYNSAAAVAVDFPAADSPTAMAAAALFGQANLDRSPGQIKKVAVFGVDTDTVTAANIGTTLDTLRETNDNWYFLLPTVTDNDMMVALSAWASTTVLSENQISSGLVESEKLLILQTSDESGLTDAMKSNGQTVVIYNHDAANSYIPPAWVGRVAPNYPTAVTWKWKELAGIPATDKIGLDLQELLDDYYNLYITNHGRQYMAEGICTNGEFIDTVIGRWQIKEAMRQNLTNMFVDTEVVPYDDAGFTMVGAAIIAALDDAVANGIILSQDGAGVYALNLPTRSAATDDQVSSRVMPPIAWSATLRGGIHGVKINGVLTISLVTTTA